MLLGAGSIAAQQENGADATVQLPLHTCLTMLPHTRHFASDMTLKIHSNASHLSEPKPANSPDLTCHQASHAADRESSLFTVQSHQRAVIFFMRRPPASSRWHFISILIGWGIQIMCPPSRLVDKLWTSQRIQF
jgi:hypothetical protein